MKVESWPVGVFVKRYSNPELTTLSHNNLRVGTFNCRGIRSSVSDIQELCELCDIIFIQELLLNLTFLTMFMTLG